ncbi:MAG TPA: aminopeptidase P family N-terminal domain-containing protein, partial [Acidimicrobiia bacterium]|nr:aminopeptidase P family N-terminal domain-containing protein [Acidimicrobiia bacterium]
MTVEGYQPFTRQIPHCFPDRGGADVELDGDVGLDQPRPSGQVTTQDGSAQGVPDQIDGSDPSRARDIEAETVLHVLYSTEYIAYDPRRFADQEGAISRYAKGPFAVDWEDRYDFAELRRQRVNKAHEALAGSDADAVLVWKDENVRYLTSLRAQLIAGKTTSLNGALLTADDDPVLLGSGGEIDKARFGMSWIGEAHAVPIMEQRELVDGFVTDILIPLLQARGLTSGRLAVDQANISFIDSMRAHLPDLELVDGDTVMQQARWIKTDLEVAVIEEACAIGDSVTQRALDETRAGRRELDVAADAMQTLFQLGGEMAHVITPFVATGEHMSPPHRL